LVPIKICDKEICFERGKVLHSSILKVLHQPKNAVFWDVLVFLRSLRRLLVTANVPSSPILVTLMMEALRSSETSVLTRATRFKIPEDDILHSHRHENLKSYIALTGWAL
jgi:hypothetical protein